MFIFTVVVERDGPGFAHAGAMFAAPVEVVLGDIIERDGFAFADLLPA